MSAALLMLSMELGVLADLRNWEPVGSLVEQVAGSLRGHDGMTEGEVARARAWAQRWARLAPDLRAFYAEVAPEDPVATGCLVRLLDGGPEPAGRAIGFLHQLWRDRRGYSPPFPLWVAIRL